MNDKKRKRNMPIAYKNILRLPQKDKSRQQDTIFISQYNKKSKWIVPSWQECGELTALDALSELWSAAPNTDMQSQDLLAACVLACTKPRVPASMVQTLGVVGQAWNTRTQGL